MVSDLFGFEPVVAVIGGRAFALRFDMRAVFALERRFGSMGDGLTALFDPDGFRDAVAVFVLAAAGAAGDGVDSSAEDAAVLLDAGDWDAGLLRERVLEALGRCFAEPDEFAVPGDGCGTDWDEVYYIGRYRLLMSDDEFWGSTPRRFDKLHRLWLTERGLLRESRVYMGDFGF